MGFHNEMQAHRPPAPDFTGDGLHSQQVAAVRDRLNRQYRHELLVWWATCAGRRIVGRVGDPLNEELESLFNAADSGEDICPRFFCAECYAGCSPEFHPQRGLDSHQECAEDGEPVFWTVPLTSDEVWRHRVFNILVDTCGASEGMREEFVFHWPDCREFRFQCRLGFGGKVYDERPASPRVSCYSEDENPYRVAAIAEANARLATLPL